MKEIVIKTLIVLLMICVVIPALLMWQGWAVSTLWGWFVVPLGLPAIGIAAAAGLCLVASAIRMRKSKGTQTNSEKYEVFAGLILIPPISVLMGWIIKTFA